MNEDELSLAKASAEGTAAGLTKSFHELILKLAGPAAEQIGGAFGEQMFVWRLQRARRLQERVNEILDGRPVLHPLAPRVLLPALQHASLEHDDGLQDQWAFLLATAGTDPKASEYLHAFVEILSRLSSLDVRLLTRLDAYEHCGGYDENELDEVIREISGIEETHSTASRLAVDNIRRLGLIDGRPYHDDPPQFRHYTLTSLGVEFIHACNPASALRKRNSH